MRLVGELLLDLVVRARRIGDIEPPLLVEVGDDRAIDERRPGGALDFEAIGNGERLAGERDSSPGAGKGSRGDDGRETRTDAADASDRR